LYFSLMPERTKVPKEAPTRIVAVLMIVPNTEVFAVESVIIHSPQKEERDFLAFA